MKDKIGSKWIVEQAVSGKDSGGDVIAALTSLGYSPSESARAAASLPDGDKLDLEEKIRLALRYFSEK